MTDTHADSEPLPCRDDALVRRAKTDRAAFAALFDRYYPQVSRYCLRRLSVRSSAEDVTSEVVLQVASHIGTFAGQTETEFRRWLFRIATNAIAACARQNRRRANLWQFAAHRGALERSTHGRPGDAMVDRLDWPAVQAAIAELDEREQTIVTLRFFAALSHEEIADIVHASVGATRAALTRALSRLRKRLNA